MHSVCQRFKLVSASSQMFLKSRHLVVLQHRAPDLKVPCTLHKNCWFHATLSLLVFDSKTLVTLQIH